MEVFTLTEILLYFRPIHKRWGRGWWVVYISNKSVMNPPPVEGIEENETVLVSVTGCVKIQPNTKLLDGVFFPAQC